MLLLKFFEFLVLLRLLQRLNCSQTVQLLFDKLSTQHETFGIFWEVEIILQVLTDFGVESLALFNHPSLYKFEFLYSWSLVHVGCAYNPLSRQRLLCQYFSNHPLYQCLCWILYPFLPDIAGQLCYKLLHEFLLCSNTGYSQSLENNSPQKQVLIHGIGDVFFLLAVITKRFTAKNLSFFFEIN